MGQPKPRRATSLKASRKLKAPLAFQDSSKNGLPGFCSVSKIQCLRIRVIAFIVGRESWGHTHDEYRGGGYRLVDSLNLF